MPLYGPRNLFAQFRWIEDTSAGILSIFVIILFRMLLFALPYNFSALGARSEEFQRPLGGAYRTVGHLRIP